MEIVNIGIAGLGTVGSEVAKQLQLNSEFLNKKAGKKLNLVAVSANNKNKVRNFDISNLEWFPDAEKMANSKEISLVIELIGGSDGVALDLCKNSLINGKSVVTANKAMMSKHGYELAKLSETNNCSIAFEASVAGCIPIIKSLRDALSGSSVNSISGILNGTCNYILSEMESSKESFSNVLKRAQKLGYAEPGNPKLDLNGYDAFAKIRILSSLSFNKKISNKKCLMEGIENIEFKDIEIADQLNFRIKLLGITELINNKLFERVHPCLVKKDSYIANVSGVMNAVILHGEPVGESVLQGEGAGPGATSSALMSDLLSILRGNIKFPFGVSSAKRKSISSYDLNKYLNSLYLRFEVNDKPGVLSQITQSLAKKNISVERLIQIPDHKNKKASIIIITHKTNESDANKCLKMLKANRNILKIPTRIRLF